MPSHGVIKEQTNQNDLVPPPDQLHQYLTKNIHMIISIKF